jgi:hypothetical protein
VRDQRLVESDRFRCRQRGANKNPDDPFALTHDGTAQVERMSPMRCTSHKEAKRRFRFRNFFRNAYRNCAVAGTLSETHCKRAKCEGVAVEKNGPTSICRLQLFDATHFAEAVRAPGHGERESEPWRRPTPCCQRRAGRAAAAVVERGRRLDIWSKTKLRFMPVSLKTGTTRSARSRANPP